MLLDGGGVSNCWIKISSGEDVLSGENHGIVRKRTEIPLNTYGRQYPVSGSIQRSQVAGKRGEAKQIEQVSK
jgi:hypothetical protein